MTQKQLITANNAELEKHKQDILSLPMADDVKNGKYVWGKYDAKGGTLLSYTVSDLETAYPDGGEKDGFWWERVKASAPYGIFINEQDGDGNALDVVVRGNSSKNFIVSQYLKLTKTKSLLIDFDAVEANSFSNMFYNITNLAKTKVNVRSIGERGFMYWAYNTKSTQTKVFLSKKVETMGKEAFYSMFAAATKFYCEAPSKPSGWNTSWHYVDGGRPGTVMWGVTESQFDAL